MLFGSLFAAYFFVRFNVAEQWPPIANNGEPFELPVVLTAVNTAILISSSFTLHWAEHRLKHYGDRKGLERGLLVTILLGATFLIVQINEYIHLGFTPQDQAFSGAFYSLTGFHGLHVFVGATLLTLCYIRVKRAHDFSSTWATPLTAASLYWHFVDVGGDPLHLATSYEHCLRSGARAWSRPRLGAVTCGRPVAAVPDRRRALAAVDGLRGVWCLPHAGRRRHRGAMREPSAGPNLDDAFRASRPAHDDISSRRGEAVDRHRPAAEPREWTPVRTRERRRVVPRGRS